MKIEKVIIEGFRAYKTKSDGTFDFLTEEGECANLVAIYAPNGFGKSSFYDAVEWALTNNISRYLVASQKNNNNKTSIGLNTSGEYQFILRNNQIESNSTSRVIIQTENFHYINWVPKINKGSRDYKFDPNQTFKDTEDLTDIFLSQDAIDNFIKEVRAEDRYIKFMRHFDLAEETYRSNLLSASNTNKSKIKSLSDELKKLDEQLQRPINSKILDIINNGISELVAKGAKLSTVTVNFGTGERAELKTKLSKYEIATRNKINELSTTIDEAQVLVNAESTYYLHRTEKKKILTTIPELDQLIASATQREDLLSSKLRLENSLLMLDEEQRQDSTIGALLPAYSKSTSDIKNIETALRSLKTEIASLEVKLSENQTTALDAQAKSALIDKQLLDLLNQETHSHKRYASLSELKQNLELMEFDADLDIHTLSELKIKTKSAKLQLERLESLIEKPPLELVEHAKLLDIDRELTRALQHLLENKEQQETSLATSKSKLSQFQIYQSEISRLIELGQGIIHHSNQSDCPLCSTPFESYQHLSQRILECSPLTSEQSALTEAISETQESINKLASDISQLTKRIIEKVNLEAAKLRAQLTEKILAIEDTENQISSRNEATLKLKASISDLEEQLQNLKQEEYLERIVIERNILQPRREELQEILQKSQSIVYSLSDQLSVHKSKYDSQELLLTSLQADPALDIVKSCSERLNKLPENLSDFFDSRVQSRTKLREETNTKIMQIDTALSEHRHKPNDTLKDRNLLITEVSGLKNQLMKLEAALSPYNNFLTKLSISANEDTPALEVISKIRSQITELSQKREIYNSNYESYGVISKQIEELEPFLKNQQALNAAVGIREQIDHHSRIQSMIDEDYSQVINHLHNRIGRFFSQDLINEIYGQIDPHPEFKRIEFKCDFNGDNGPRLDVLIKDKTNKLSAPNFHFSTAQLNILSLSIFLARAINRNPSSHPIDSIFIDDPIHSMDSINILSTIDMLRNICKQLDKQIIISTHDENFFKLLKKKIPEHIYNSKFIQLETYGKVAR